MQQELLHYLRWVRTFGDLVFIVGAIAVALQVIIGLRSTRSYQEEFVDTRVAQHTGPEF